MAWKGVHISQAARLGLRDQQLVVGQSDGEVLIPIEDVAYLVLDTPQSTVTGAVLTALALANVVVVQCDARHHPAMMALPFHGHHKQAEIVHLQIETTLPFRKRAWQKIVKAKIENQKDHLLSLGRDAAVLPALVGRVKTGDSDNLEAQAARVYWGKLFEKFRRDDDKDARNSRLNYGYAIVRAAIARAITAAGLIPAFGLHHASVSNAFNLADDLIEPFRPTVDALAFSLSTGGNHSNPDIGLDERRSLVGIMTAPIRMGHETMTLLAATEQCAFSLVRAIREKNPDALKLPAFQMHNCEIEAI